MYKIGEFSTLSKTTIKTLRYYEKEKLLIPSFVDEETGYRFYDTTQLLDLSRIVSLRQMGLSIQDIKSIMSGENLNDILSSKKKSLENLINDSNNQLSRINGLLEGKIMKYEIVIKELPDCTVYYKEGIIEDFSKITDFILSSGEECIKLNPGIKCISPEYCYVSYLDGEYKDKDIKIRYAQAVEKAGIESDTIKFEKLKPIESACVFHKGSYSKLGEAYSSVLKWVEENGYKITEPIRERYIDGMWNKESEEEWLTEIQVPIVKK